MRKRLLLTCFLFMTCSSAIANWVFVGVNLDGSEYYIESSTVKKNGDIARAWQLTNFKDPLVVKEIVASSVKEFMEVDCKQERFRSLQQILYSERDGGGKIVFNNGDPGAWNFGPPNSVIIQFIQRACHGKISR